MSETEQELTISAPDSEPAPASVKAPTEYVILHRAATDATSPSAGTQGYVVAKGWTEFSRITTANAATAIKQAIEADVSKASSGSYVAVPLRSWKPVKVTIETKPTIQMGD